LTARGIEASVWHQDFVHDYRGVSFLKALDRSFGIRGDPNCETG
jgi:hypothetical protein